MSPELKPSQLAILVQFKVQADWLHLLRSKQVVAFEVIRDQESSVDISKGRLRKLVLYGHVVQSLLFSNDVHSQILQRGRIHFFLGSQGELLELYVLVHQDPGQEPLEHSLALEDS